MAEIGIPKPVKLIVGILFSEESLLEHVDNLLQKRLGRVDIRSNIIPFNFTDYYRNEMGPNLSRRFLSFSRLISPEELPVIKTWTNKLEEEIKHEYKPGVARPVNLDPGYLTHCNLILASTKDYYHRIHLQDGIYAEVTLFYQHEAFRNLPWTYPDYQTEEYKNFFLKVRTLYAEDISNN